MAFRGMTIALCACLSVLCAAPARSVAPLVITSTLAPPDPIVLGSDGQPSGGSLPALPVAAGDPFHAFLQWDETVAADTSDPLMTVFPGCGEGMVLEIFAADGSGASGFVGYPSFCSYSSLDPAEPLDFDADPVGPSFAAFAPSLLEIDFADPRAAFAGDRLPNALEMQNGLFPAGIVRLRVSDGFEAFELPRLLGPA